MSAEQLRGSMGGPGSENTTATALGTEQRVYYDAGAYFYLTDNILTSWQETSR